MKIGTMAFVAALLVQTPAFAFPPTATTSPGYDRALAESRRARQMEQPYVVPAPRVSGPQTRKQKRRH